MLFDMSQLNLPHGTTIVVGSVFSVFLFFFFPLFIKSGNRQTKMKKTDMLRSIGKQSGESVESVPKKKRKIMVGRTCRKGRF